MHELPHRSWCYAYPFPPDAAQTNLRRLSRWPAFVQAHRDGLYALSQPGLAMTSTAVPISQRAYVIAMCSIIGAAFAYAACEWGLWPRLAYLPWHGEFTFSPAPGTTAMYYLGIVAWGVGGMASGALVGAILVRLVPRPWSDTTLQLFGAWAITAVMLAGAYFTWGLLAVTL